METKETNYKSVLKSNIILFLSYSILFGFIFLLIGIIVKCAIANLNNWLLASCLSLIGGILLFYLSHFITKSSTLESFKQVRLDKKNTENFTKKMNLFFILSTLLCVFLCLSYLMIDNLLYANAIHQAYEQYDFISHELAGKIANHIQESYQDTFLCKISSTIILELSLVISFLSLIPYQKKLLEKYNK